MNNLLSVVLLLSLTCNAFGQDTTAIQLDTAGLQKKMMEEYNKALGETSNSATDKDDEDDSLTLENLGNYSENVFFLNIDLRVNNIEKVPENFAFPNLTFLMVHHLPPGRKFNFDEVINSVLYIPIQEIYIFNNGKGFTTIPQSIGEIKTLKRLDLFNNAITSLPDEMGNLDSLEELSLEMNNIKHLPASFSKLKSLKKLGLEKNPIPVAEITRLQGLLPKCKITYSK